MKETRLLKNEGRELPAFNVGDIVQLAFSTDVVKVAWVGTFLTYQGKTSVVPQQITHAVVGNVVRFYGNQHSRPKTELVYWPIDQVILADESNKKRYNELT